MAFKTSNQLTPGHGVSPISAPDEEIALKRAFLVYIKFTTRMDVDNNVTNHLRIRQFYYDYDKIIDGPEALIEQCLLVSDGNSEMDIADDIDVTKANGFCSFDYDRRVAPYKRRPFPHIFDKHLAEVNFGWEPCHVIYLLDNDDYEFVSSDGKPDSLNQPVVFRRDKALVDAAGNAAMGKDYQPNYSFFNLRTGRSDRRNRSYLIMDNHMKEGVDQIPIEGKKPLTGNPDPTWPVWHYCMDINVRIPQARKSMVLSEGNQGIATQDAGENPSLTIVFDPPQNNGNGNGP